MTERPRLESAGAAVSHALGEFEWRQVNSKYTSAEQFIGFLRERGYDVTPIQEDTNA